MRYERALYANDKDGYGNGFYNGSRNGNGISVGERGPHKDITRWRLGRMACPVHLLQGADMLQMVATARLL